MAKVPSNDGTPLINISRLFVGNHKRHTLPQAIIVGRVNGHVRDYDSP